MMNNITVQAGGGSLPAGHSYGCTITNQLILGGSLQERYTEGGSASL